MQNPFTQQSQYIQVACHSGYKYADRPISLMLGHQRFEITVIESEWLEPGKKHFIIQTAISETLQDEKRFHICYDTTEDSWQLKENL